MSSTLIGLLLDEALAWARANDPKPVTMKMPDGKEYSVQPRSVVRGLLAERLREVLGEAVLDFDDDGPCPNDDRLLELCRGPSLPLLPKQQDEFLLDAVLGKKASGSVTAIKVDYGFEVDKAMASIDRLLFLNWLTYQGDRGIDLVLYLFIHEMCSGESPHETERAYSDWLLAHYGPFAGLDRIGLPELPRLTRSAKCSVRGTFVSAVDLETRPTGLIAFCVSFRRDQF